MVAVAATAAATTAAGTGAGTGAGAGGEAVAISYLPAYIVLSYIVSVMGCATTLELLHRRTSRSGIYNWYLLITSSITMGGIGTWCMHFIGNRAVVLGNGDAWIQISYSVAFTAVSFALPVVVLLLAFYAVGVQEKAGYPRILMGGVLTGCAVCGMHYVGQLGIANYTCHYEVKNVVGAAIIAVFAATTALGVFFRWRATWTDSWWRRGLCACLLAVAVSGMHWTATVGTTYLKHDLSRSNGNQLSRSQTVIVCAVLSCASCVILSICAIAAGDSIRKSTTRAHQLVLACAFFDPSGRVMVTPQAFLPNHKIVEHYIGRTFKDDDLTQTHSAFLWAFRASRNWKLVKDLVPFMKSRLESEQALLQQHVTSQGAVLNKGTELQSDFDTLFKQLFCVAAQDLADELRQPLQDLGVLYDDVVTTSTASSMLYRMVRGSSSRNGRGQLVFTVRQLSKQEAARFGAAGFRFASIEHVTPALSRRMHVPVSDLAYHLRDMRDYASSSRIFQPGIHVISFVMRPTVHDTFEILSCKGVGNPLPSATLPIRRLNMQHMLLLSHLDGRTLSNCLKWLRSDAAKKAHRDVDDFREHMILAISDLFVALPPDINDAAQFSARPLVAPCRSPRFSSDGQQAAALQPPEQRQCTLLAFCAVASLDTQVSNPDFAFTPYRLFKVQQQVNDNVVDGDGFSKELSQELFYSNIRSNSESKASTTNPTVDKKSHRFWPSRGIKGHLRRTSLGISHNGTAHVSQESLVDERRGSSSSPIPPSPRAQQSSIMRSSSGGTLRSDKDISSNNSSNGTTPTLTMTTSPTMTPDTNNPFRDIMVRKEVRVDVAQLDDSATQVSQNSQDSLLTTVAGGAGVSSSTFVDELYSLCHAPGIRLRPALAQRRGGDLAAGVKMEV